MLPGKLPEIRQAAFGRGAFDKEDAGVPFQNGKVERHIARLLFRQPDRHLPLGTGGARGAEFFGRARTATGNPRKTHGSAEFHHGLIEVSGPARIKQARGFRGKTAPRVRRRDFRSVVSQTADHANSISVHCGVRQIERDTGDGGSRVRARARQREHIFVRRRYTCRRYLFCRPVQVAGAAVITETAPGGKNVVLRRGGQGINGGKALQKGAVVGNHGLDPGLLKHDFGKPDAVEIFGLTPRKIAARGVVPPQECAAKTGPGNQGGSTWTNSAITRNSSLVSSKGSNSRFKGSRRIAASRSAASTRTPPRAYFLTV